MNLTGERPALHLDEMGARIKEQRKKLGLTQERLAEMVYVTPHYIYEIERGVKAMSLETFVNISEVLGLSPDYLIYGEERTGSPTLEELLAKLDQGHRSRAENAFKALLPYL